MRPHEVTWGSNEVEKVVIGHMRSQDVTWCQMRSYKVICVRMRSYKFICKVTRGHMRSMSPWQGQVEFYPAIFQVLF